jgi:hypothetical protein
MHQLVAVVVFDLLLLLLLLVVIVIVRLVKKYVGICEVRGQFIIPRKV